MKKYSLAFLATVITFIDLIAQQPKFAKDELLLQGYEKTLSGVDFVYHSPINAATKSLLVRATDGIQSMEWQTEVVPVKFDKKFATFVWMAGMGSNVARVRMDLFINGDKKFEFYTERSPFWSLSNADGTILSFYSDFIDKHGDRMGFMFLKVPTSLLKKGGSLVLKVVGSAANTSAWYMTFCEQIKPKVEISSFPAILKGKGQSQQMLGFNIYYFGNPAKADLYRDGRKISSVNLKFGYSFQSIGIPKIESNSKSVFRLVANGYDQSTEVELKPVKEWRVNFVQHSHTDIGYTRSQTEILGEHLRYIDYALDYCDATDSYPDDSKFRWTCEASYAVDEYLRSRPHEQVERLKKRIKEGRIEVTGMYFNFDDMPDEQSLVASLKPFERFRKEGIDVKVAMQNDVNGIAWCLNDYYNTLGVKYLNMGTHGHRALICFDKPTAFWWESPSGKRMLAFRAEHYMIGNTVFGVHTDNLEDFEKKLMQYLVDLDSKGYQFNIIPIQYSGYLTDNSPPSTLGNEMIKKWNEKYEWPKLRQAIASEFFSEIEANHSSEIQVIRGAWPDWWTDGFASAAREASVSRITHAEVIANQGALSLAKTLGAKLPDGILDRIYEVNKALLYYDEHTFGADESVSNPYSKMSMEQREIKESYVWEAFRRNRMVREEVLGLLQSYYSKQDVPSILVFNTLNWRRSGMVEVYIDHQILPRGMKFKIEDNQGKEILAQEVGHRSDGTYWALWVEDIPAMGAKQLKIKVLGIENPLEKTNQSQPLKLENQWYKIEIDEKRGTISSWFDKDQGIEMVDKDAEWGMGEFIYETLGNRSQMESKMLNNFKRTPLQSVKIKEVKDGNIWTSIVLEGESEAAFGSDGVQYEIRLLKPVKQVDIKYLIVKKPIIDPEGFYIAFPFNLKDGKHYFDVQGGVVQAGIDQIPDSSNDWNTVQNFSALRNQTSQILMVSPEIPLVQFGNINTGRYKAGATPESTHLYSWPMNNYWVTNFNSYQQGGFEFSYSITSLNNIDNIASTQFGWNRRIPFMTRIIPAGVQSVNSSTEENIINILSNNILLVNAQPLENENGILLHVREIGNKASEIKVSLKGIDFLRLIETDVLGNKLSESDKPITIQPLESKFVKVVW
ncbi:MAG: glycosyl hydrolase family 38 [Bacteroidales bacterium]|nr:MAG: glycosyl hydrolase family 38 [Bacteroidales bacterium]